MHNGNINIKAYMKPTIMLVKGYWKGKLITSNLFYVGLGEMRCIEWLRA